jgi:hypothetical protein
MQAAKVVVVEVKEEEVVVEEAEEYLLFAATTSTVGAMAAAPIAEFFVVASLKVTRMQPHSKTKWEEALLTVLLAMSPQPLDGFLLMPHDEEEPKHTT